MYSTAGLRQTEALKSTNLEIQPEKINEIWTSGKVPDDGRRGQRI